MGKAVGRLEAALKIDEMSNSQNEGGKEKRNQYRGKRTGKFQRKRDTKVRNTFGGGHKWQ